MSDIAPGGLIDEHAPRDMPNTSAATYEPNPSERKAIKLAERVFEKNKKARAAYDHDWLESYHFFRGKQWKENRPSYRHSEVINLIWRTIQSTVPIQADPKPKFDYLPQEPSDYQLAQIMSDCSDSDWTRKNWGMTLLEVLYDSNIYGTGHSEVCAEYDDRSGLNEIHYESADIFYCFPDPSATDVNKAGKERAETFVHAEPVDIARVRKKYPKVAQWIKADLIDLTKGSKTDFTPYKFRSPVDNKVVVEGSPSFDTLAKDKVLVVTCYLAPNFSDAEVIEEEKTSVDPESGEIRSMFETRLKYPQGRKIVIAGGILCEDGPLPYDDGKFPFQRLQNYVLPREYWGASEIEQVKGPQKIFNKVVNFVLDVLALTGNPIWLNPATSQVEDDQLVNRTGLVVPYAGDTPPTRVEGVGLQPYVFQLIDKLAEWFDSISGSQDVTRGVQPTGITAASAISNLQEAAQTRLRLKSRVLDYYLQSVGQQYASRFFQYKSAPEVFRLTNDQNATKYFKAHVEDYQKTVPVPVTDAMGQPSHDPVTGEPVMGVAPATDESGAPVMGRQLVVQPYLENGQADTAGLSTYEISGELDVRVSTGSSLPFAKAEKEQKLKWLFEDKIIDAEEVLKGLDWPNYQGVLQRMQQQAAAAAQADAQAKAGAPAA